MGILKKLWDMLPEGRPVWVPGPAEWGIVQIEKNEDEKAESEKTEEKQSEK